MPQINIALLAKPENVSLIPACAKNACNKLPAILKAGGLIRKHHREGQKITIAQSSLPAKVILFGEHISKAIYILREYWRKWFSHITK